MFDRLVIDASASESLCEDIPLLLKGWLRLKKIMRSLRIGADGVVASLLQSATTPSAPNKEASRQLLDVAATPPSKGGEWPWPGEETSR